MLLSGQTSRVFYSSWQIRSQAQFWDWAEVTLFTALRAGQWYNGDWLPNQRGTLQDRVSRIMGYATMRQVRVKKGEQLVSGIAANIRGHEWNLPKGCSKYIQLSNHCITYVLYSIFNITSFSHVNIWCRVCDLVKIEDKSAVFSFKLHGEGGGGAVSNRHHSSYFQSGGAGVGIGGPIPIGGKLFA